MLCPKCQTANPEGAKFCMNCGTALRGDSTESDVGEANLNKHAAHGAALHGGPGDAAFLSRYLPSELMSKLEAARTEGAPAGERRVITMLFCDVKGSTAAAEQLDPEVWTEIMNGAFERMITPIYRYEGTVPRLMGDAILAFFGAPIAHEDDPERAVRAGLEIQAAMRPYADELQRKLGLEFGLRVGINTGLVVVGEIGSDLRVEYTAIGDAINLAARMEQTAAPGTVQITEQTHKLVAPFFDFQPLGGIEVKGKPQPVTAFRVLGLKRDRGRLRGLEGSSSPLVGREEPLGFLRGQLDALRAGDGGFVTIMGEAGLGKSSLVEEALLEAQNNRTESTVPGDEQENAATSQALRWLRGDALAYARSISYFPWRQIIRRSIGVRDDDPPASVRIKLRSQCKSAGLALEGAAFLEAMLAVEDDESRERVASYQGETLVNRMTETVRDYLCGIAREKPLALVFDDLHWADEASVALLLNTSQLAAGQPILFLCMLRPDREAASWASIREAQTRLAGRFHSITLQPLGMAQTEALLANLLGIREFPPKLRGLIMEKSGGNPFFVEELIRALIDTKQIVQEGGKWTATADEASLKVPDTLRGVLGARIDRLGEPERHILQLASVIGRTFEVQVLARLAAPGLEARLAKLQEAGLLEGKWPGEAEVAITANSAGSQISFRHVLIQEAAYESILIKRRQALHRQVGEALETVHGERVEEFAPLLAHHFHEAGDDRSLRYDLLAGEKAARLYANAEAAMHYRRALDVAKRIEVGAQTITELYSKLGAVLELTGSFNEALQTYNEMQALANEQHLPSMELRALMAKGTLYSTPTSLRNPEMGEQTMMQALELSGEVGDVGVQTKLTWNMMLNYLHSSRLAPALEYGQKALVLARAGGDREQLAFVLNDLGRVLICRGEFEEAFSVIREARELWNEMGNRVMQADNLGAEEEGLLSLGRYPQVQQIGSQALEISESLDNAWGKSYHRLLMGLARFECGEPGSAIELVREGIQLGDQGGLIISTIAGRCDLAWWYGWCGDVARGLELIEVALGTAKEHLPDWVVMPLAVKVRLHALRGDRAAAEAAVRGVDLVPPSLPYPHYTMMVLRARVELAWMRADYAGVLATIDAALDELERSLPGEKPQLLGRKADALLAMGRLDEAGHTLEAARTLAEGMGANGELWMILSRLAAIQAKIGKEEEASASRDEARRIVAEIGESLRAVDMREVFLGLPQVKALVAAELPRNGS